MQKIESNVSEAQCTIVKKGVYSPGNPPNSDVQCPPPPRGACCADAGCAEVPQALCRADWKGEGTKCSAANICGRSTNIVACCNGKACSEKTAKECVAGGGVSQRVSMCGDGSICMQPEKKIACCTGVVPACQEMTVNECHAMGGTPSETGAETCAIGTCFTSETKHVAACGPGCTEAINRTCNLFAIAGDVPTDKDVFFDSDGDGNPSNDVDCCCGSPDAIGGNGGAGGGSSKSPVPFVGVGACSICATKKDKVTCDGLKPHCQWQSSNVGWIPFFGGGSCKPNPVICSKPTASSSAVPPVAVSSSDPASSTSSSKRRKPVIGMSYVVSCEKGYYLDNDMQCVSLRTQTCPVTAARSALIAYCRDVECNDSPTAASCVAGCVCGCSLDRGSHTTNRERAARLVRECLVGGSDTCGPKASADCCREAAIAAVCKAPRALKVNASR